ncbi:MAG TPA: hypothetical protein VFL57_01140 [Bryobacteraceae bacterium]|nr:hypothetical protein [Bryobacteraceae bacterium]
MELFLMVACLALFGMAVTCLAFSAATRHEETRQPEVAEQKPAPAPVRTRFFADEVVAPAALQYQVPLEVLLLQIESHVRLEQAAAESFLESPASASLHSRTTSPLVH